MANFDFLKEMINSAIRNTSKSPLDSTLEMILTQKSYFPLLPITYNPDDSEKTINLDYRKLSNLKIHATPDILITCSGMKTFAKKINSTLFINVGSFYKSNKLGSLARIISYPPIVKFYIIL